MNVTKSQWAVLFYLNDELTLQEILGAKPFPSTQVLVQQNSGSTAKRYILSDTAVERPPVSVSITTPTDPIMLIDFLQWAFEMAEATHLALVCDIPAFKGFDVGESSSQSAIEIPQLQQILDQTLNSSSFEQIDILIFPSPASQFIEIGYQFANTASILIGTQSATVLGADAITAILKRWQDLIIREPSANASALAKAAISANTTLSALDLRRLNTVTRAFDSLTMALLQSLGDDIIWRALWNTETSTPFPGLPTAAKLSKSNIDLIGWLTYLAQELSQSISAALPRWYVKKLKKSTGTTRVEMRQIGRDSTNPTSLEAAIAEHLDNLPEWLAKDFRIIRSQRQRAASLADMAERIISLLKESDGLVLTSGDIDAPFHGISIHFPQDIDRLTDSDYLGLDFNRHTHWTSLLGGINLIAKHPRALWRLSSSLLTTSNSQVRENLLRRLIGPESVMVGFREQFQALANPAKLTLSLEPLGTTGTTLTDTFRLRLESPETGATVLEQKSRVNPQTVESALEGLQSLLSRGWVNSHRMSQLEALGRTLGEDIIQDLADSLNQEYRRMAWLKVAATETDSKAAATPIGWWKRASCADPPRNPKPNKSPLPARSETSSATRSIRLTEETSESAT